MEYCVIIAKLTLCGNPIILVSFILLIVIDSVNHTTCTSSLVSFVPVLQYLALLSLAPCPLIDNI